MKLLKQSPARLSVKKLFTELFLSEFLPIEKAAPLMSFHHYRRLTEHWPENTKDLTPAAIAVAITISSHLDADTNHWAMSAKSLSKWTNGIAPSTIQRAVVALEALGVFQVSRERQRRPKDYRLLVACPKGCERLDVHNTPSELKALAKEGKKDRAQTTQSDHSETQTTQSDYSQTLNLTNSVEQIELTNRTSIEPLIEKDDKKKSFEFLFITETLQALRASNGYKSEHALLDKALQDNPELIEAQASKIMGKANSNPRNYLKSSITDYPLSLIPKQETKGQPSQALPKLKTGRLYENGASTGELEAVWNRLKEHQELCDWQELDRGHIDFLARLYKDHTPLSNTSASMITTAVREKLNLGDYDSPNPRSLTELSELLEQNRERVRG